MDWKGFWQRFGAKITSRKLWGFLIVLGSVIFIGFQGGWEQAVEYGKVVIPVVATAFMLGIAYQGKKAGS